ncbi:hypothetical protein GCM10007853_21040 [Algimonas ampicilliniresistens]|uniref:Methyltransferase type 12 domain-containing protein n=1 Tax=Algimonas ampicilliniresistens TaxID=1298735 RepID=A0ABQ5VC05_9PROT|nr:methyltransferase [Algimonas ampicilliniresistens]GLQ24230.1 hypothetical protein GCM10007853_21040 [Algimonas ampicilliniresistens]
MANIAKFWDKMAEKYSKSPVPNEEVYQIKKDLTREYFTSESTIFEFGCGTGTTAIAHAPYVKQVTATDISTEMLRIAKDKAAAAKVNNVTFEPWDVSTGPLPGTDYDVVLALSILHLVDDLPGALDKCSGLLKDGGVLVSSTVCLSDKKAFLRPILGFLKPLGLVPFVAFLKNEELEEQMQSAGFQTVHRWHPIDSDAVFIISRKAQ